LRRIVIVAREQNDAADQRVAQHLAVFRGEFLARNVGHDRANQG
jgi:hypothetical protein